MSFQSSLASSLGSFFQRPCEAVLLILSGVDQNIALLR